MIEKMLNELKCQHYKYNTTTGNIEVYKIDMPQVLESELTMIKSKLLLKKIKSRLDDNYNFIIEKN